MAILSTGKMVGCTLRLTDVKCGNIICNHKTNFTPVFGMFDMPTKVDTDSRSDGGRVKFSL